jgi:hypothetical protein
MHLSNIRGKLFTHPFITSCLDTTFYANFKTFLVLMGMDVDKPHETNVLTTAMGCYFYCLISETSLQAERYKRVIAAGLYGNYIRPFVTPSVFTVASIVTGIK